MQYIYHQFPTFRERRVSICDSRIYKITFGADFVRFHFTNGLFSTENCEATVLKDGFVELGCGDADEFNCVIYKRKPAVEGALLVGSHISIFELNQRLQESRTTLEVYLELYDFNYLYWRCAILPNDTSKLTDRVDIELSGNYLIKYVGE